MFAREQPITYHISSETRFSAKLAAQDLVPTRRTLGTTTGPASKLVAELLGLTAAAQVTVVEMLGYADGVPLVVSTMHVPEAWFPGVQERLAGLTTFTGLLEQYRLSDYRRDTDLMNW